MLDRLIELIGQWIDHLLPIIFVMEYEQGAHFRAGRFLRVLDPGPHWKIPVVDRVDTYDTVTTTLSLPFQSITTKDGRTIVLRAVLKFYISNVSVYAVKVMDAQDALSDRAQGILFRHIRSLDIAGMWEADLPSATIDEVKKEGKRWGITVTDLTISDLAEMRSYRLIGTNEHKEEHQQ